MAQFATPKDLERLYELFRQLLACDAKAEISQLTVKGLRQLIDAETAIWGEFGKGLVMVSGDFSSQVVTSSDFTKLGEAFQATLHTHPSVEYNLVKFNRPTVTRLSDKVSQQDFRSRPIFEEVYRKLEFEYQLGFDAKSLHFQGVGVSFGRKSRDFDDREVAIVKLAVPMIMEAYWRVERWNNRQADTSRFVWNVRLNRDLMITDILPEAAEFLKHHYRAKQAHIFLPEPLMNIIRKRQQQNKNLPWRDVTPTRIPGKPKQKKIEVLTSRTDAFDYLLNISVPVSMTWDYLSHPDYQALTAQEQKVFACLAEHKSPAQIADELGIQKGTVSTHIRNIRYKTGVTDIDQAIKKLMGL